MPTNLCTRNYNNLPGISPDYYLVRAFFINLKYAEFTYARWDWMITHSYLDTPALEKIKLWTLIDQATGEEEVVGIATFDTRLGTAYCLTLPEYRDLKSEMLQYAAQALKDPETNNFSVVISDEDHDFQKIALKLGYIATPERESDALYTCDQMYNEDGKLPEVVPHKLPDGYHMVTMADRYDPLEYRRVLWKGFNHEINGEGPLVFTEEDKKGVDLEMLRPNVDLSLKIAIVAPDGHFAAYCGMWYTPELDYAVIEPVATDPDHRKLGLAKVAVLEGIRRCAAMGAKKALVGSSQQFYYSIGMVPYKTASIWRKHP